MENAAVIEDKNEHFNSIIDLSTCYILTMLFAVTYIHIKFHSFSESRSVSSHFCLLFSLLQFLRRFFSSALFYLNFLP